MRVTILAIFAGFLSLVGGTFVLLEWYQANEKAALIAFTFASFGLAVLGYIVLFNARKIVEWQWRVFSPASRKFLKSMGYTDSQLQSNSLLIPWSSKRRRWGEIVTKIWGGILAYAGTIWFIVAILTLLGVIFKGVFS